MGAEDRYRRIAEVIRDIPAGRVASYGQVAEIAGVPRGARLVVRVLRETDGLPWYRVVQAKGTLAFEPGSAAFARQTGQLMMEGVAVIGGRIDMRRYRWQPDLDELLWKPSDAWDRP